MKRIIVCLTTLWLLTLLSCDSTGVQDTIKSDQQTLAKKMAFPFNTPKVADQASITQLRSYTKELILKRQKNLREDLHDITYYYESPRGFANLNKTLGQQHFVGQWLKFEKDYTYKYGIGNEEIGGGIYHHAGSDSKLFMLDNDIQLEPKLWDLKSNSEFFNFLGRPIIVIEDDNGHGQVLMSNFSNDAFLGRQKILVESKNGMQIMMTLLEKKPTP